MGISRSSWGAAEASGSYAPATLVERILAGDRSAEDDLVRQYGHGVLAILRHSACDRSLLDDLYQECFRLVLEKVRAGEVREPERLSGFICSIARNLMIEYFRKSSRRERYHEPDCGQQIPSPAPGPLDHLLSDENATLVRRVLAALPSQRDRDVLYRFYLAEEDREKICAVLGIAAAHLNQILCRARQRYRVLFEQFVEAQRVPICRRIGGYCLCD